MTGRDPLALLQLHHSWRPAFVYIECMRKILCTLAFALLLLVTASFTGLVGFRYPTVVEDEPLLAPSKVLFIDGDEIHLTDSRVIRIRSTSAQSLREAIAESDFSIDVSGCGDLVVIYARQDGWICGTPWAQPICIPLIPETVYQNRRELLAIGELTKAE